MPFKSHQQPLCRTCGQPIRKHTTVVYVNDKHSPMRKADDAVIAPDGLYSKAACQKLTNKQITSLRYHDGRVWWFHTWDGESYANEFFCSNQCGEAFGYMAAKSGKVQSVAYADAIKRGKVK